MLKVFSTFTGIGGFEIGIKNAALDIFGEGIDHVDVVGYSEIDKYAIQVYDYWFKGVKNYGDITKIKAEDLPDFDCLVGGFPCQAFSVAGKRAGFNDTRGTLFFDLARILRAKQPRLFVFENVKGLCNHDSGRTFATILKTITELGYDCQWQVVNSKDFGVPQNRERIIIVGHLRGTARPQVFPIERADRQASQTNEIVIDDTQGFDGVRTYPISPSLRANRAGLKVGTLRTHKDGNGFREMKSGFAPTLPARAREDGSGQPIIYVPEATQKGFAEATVGDSINLAQPNSKTRRGRVGKQIANTLTTAQQQYTVQPVITPDRINKSQNGRRFKDDGEPAFAVTATDRHGVMLSKTVRAGGRNSPHGSKQNWDSYEVNGVIRRLTPLECERLQAYPDDWTKWGVSTDDKVIEISDTQRYKMCGNGITTNVVQAVFERIFAS